MDKNHMKEIKSKLLLLCWLRLLYFYVTLLFGVLVIHVINWSHVIKQA